jgi:hypothetical protein
MGFRLYNKGMSPTSRRTLFPVVRKRRLGERKDDAHYWRSRPFVERLAALEQIRAEYHHWQSHAEPGFQRVCRIVKRNGLK